MLDPDDHVGLYRIEGLVGQGGWTRVYRAVFAGSRVVTLKVLLPAATQHASFVKRWQWEGAARAELSHPCLVPIRAVGSLQPGRPYAYLVTDYMARGSLADLLGAPRSPDEVVALLRPVATALDFAHGRGRLHRRLTLANILLDADGRPLLDWSVAEMATAALDAPPPATLAPALSPLAPEQARGELVEPRTDQFALAALACALLTGRLPYDAGSPLAVRRPRDLAPTLGEALDDALLRGLAREPQDRYPTVAAFVAELERAAARSPSSQTSTAASDWAARRPAPPHTPPASPTPPPSAFPLNPTPVVGQTAPEVSRHPASRPETDPPRLAEPSPSVVGASPATLAEPHASRSMPDFVVSPPKPSARVGGSRRDGPKVLTLAVCLIAASLLVGYHVTVGGGAGRTGPAPLATGLVPTARSLAVAAPPTAAAIRRTLAAGVPLATGAGAPTVAIVAPSLTPAPPVVSLSPPTATSGGTPAFATSAPRVTPAALGLTAVVDAGQGLCGLATDDAGGRMYVSDYAARHVLVLDATTRKVVRTLPVGDWLCGLAFDQQQGVVWAPTYHRASDGPFESSRLVGLSLATGVAVGHDAPHFPIAPFFDPPTRALYLANTDDPSLDLVNTATGQAGVSLPVGSLVNRVAISPATGRLYLAAVAANLVLVADPTTRTVVARVNVANGPWGVAVEPRGGHVLVTVEGAGRVAVLDPTTNHVVRTVPTGGQPHDIACDPTHPRCYVLNTADRTVTSLAPDASGAATSAPLPGTDPLTGLAVSAKTGQVWVVTKRQLFVLAAAG